MVSVRKRAHVSKKTRKYWKQVDTKDVDAFLDDKRLEERLGVPFAERKSSEIYQVDTKGGAKQTPCLSKKQIRQQPKEFRCFEILKPHTAVPDPIVKRNRVRTSEERKDSIVKKIEESRKLQGIKKAKEIQAERDRALTLQKKLSSVPVRGDFCKDIWENDDTSKLEKASEWLDPTTVAHTVKNTRTFRKSVPKTVLKKPSKLPPIETPHPGMSYNPSFEDHQSLLRVVAEAEMKVQKQEKHLERVTTKMFSRVTERKRDENWLSDMSQGLDTLKEEDDVEEEKDMDPEYKAINPPAKNKKKSLQKRKKLRKLKEEEEKRKKVLVEKKKRSDVLRLNSITQEISSKEKKLAALREKREKVKAAKANEPKKVSKVKFQPLDLEFSLGRELQGNLRNMKPEGSLLKTAFNSMQKRNIIEPTKRHTRKKGKVKRFEKRSYKMGWEPKGY